MRGNAIVLLTFLNTFCIYSLKSSFESRKFPKCYQLISFRERHVFTVILSVLGCSINFKIKQKFLLKQPASPDYLPVSCEYDETENQNLNIFLILYSINDYIIGLFPRAIEVEYLVRASHIRYRETQLGIYRNFLMI